MTAEDREETRKIFQEMDLSEKQLKQVKMGFVTREECNATTEDLANKLSRDFADLAVIKFQTKLVIGILSAVGVAVLSLVIKQFWG